MHDYTDNLAPMISVSGAEGAGGLSRPSRCPGFQERDLCEALRIAAAYPPEAAHTPASERERYFTPIQQAAWQMRFRPEGVTAEMLSASAAKEMAETQPKQVEPAFSPHR